MFWAPVLQLVGKAGQIKVRKTNGMPQLPQNGRRVWVSQMDGR